MWVQISARREFILSDAFHGFLHTSAEMLPKVRPGPLRSTYFLVIIGLDTAEPLILRFTSGFPKWFFDPCGFRRIRRNAKSELRHVCLSARVELGSHGLDFIEMLHMSIFRKSAEKIHF